MKIVKGSGMGIDAFYPVNILYISHMQNIMSS